ncbi:hypothetical protein O6H91_12G080100 [Diphasiastrum complanatum]|uniref:Uncharacterized protein n=1 Tax=Diphasiastrum complanatum TaxID=34168 RepID=A0ACC2C413_DIPCM|nr:hypothetical protein O6H91_12G080100 [Diphasiastrum complanatum]
MTTMRHIPASSFYAPKHTWLDSRFHFSYAEYYNPQNINFGVIRLLNDDFVKPLSGFDTHPHNDMEVYTYVVEGELTHNDSMGTAETLGPGSIQYMSAGRGISHSERNLSANKELHFLQIWIKPNEIGLDPDYGSRVFKKEDRHNKIQHVATNCDGNNKAALLNKDTGEGIIPIHQDANIYISEVDAGVEQEFVLQMKRQAYMVCIEGALSVNQHYDLQARDALEIKADIQSPQHLKLKADQQKGAHFLLIEMATEQ